MVNVHVHVILGAFLLYLFYFLFSIFIFFWGGGIFNKTVIPLALVGLGYELIIANSALYAPCWLFIISYPVCSPLKQSRIQGNTCG